LRDWLSSHSSERIASTAVRLFGGLAEGVVEDLQREGARVARAQRLLEEVLHVELALSREAAVVARPLQDVHGQQRRIGHLHEEDAFAGNVRDARGIVAQREGVEAVEDQTQVRMRGALDDGPGVSIAVHVASPGQRLEADAQVAPSRPLRQLVELRRGALVAGERLRRGVGAHQHQRCAERLHHVELALGTIEAALELDVRHAFEVAERLVQVDGEAQVGRDRPQLGRRAVEVDEVGLEQLDAVEARGGNGFQLVAQRAAQRDRGDGPAHAIPR
jgi:hypothetical protein